MNNKHKYLCFKLAAFALILGFMGCDKTGNPKVEIEPQAISLKLAKVGSTENVLTDANGRTLYYFTKDTDGTPTCTGDCIAKWPVFEVDANKPLKISISAGVDTSLIKTVASPNNNGKLQLVYNGWPLYYYSGDASAGDAKGEGLGGVWFLARPVYNIMLANKVVVENGTAINYLVDSHGRTLYYFTVDSKGTSACEGPCLANWPAFYADKITAPSTLKSEDFGEITRADKNKQSTYRGWPLYYYKNDSKRGSVNGEAVGGKWYVHSPDYTVMVANGDFKDVPSPRNYLTDAYGRTLYLFARDGENLSACSGECIANWPVFYQSKIVGPSMLKKAQGFETLTRSDESGGGDNKKQQVTYDKKALYYFVNDKKAFETNGHGVNDVWYVVTPKP